MEHQDTTNNNTTCAAQLLRLMEKHFPHVQVTTHYAKSESNPRTD